MSDDRKVSEPIKSSALPSAKTQQERAAEAEKQRRKDADDVPSDRK